MVREYERILHYGKRTNSPPKIPTAVRAGALRIELTEYPDTTPDAPCFERTIVICGEQHPTRVVRPYSHFLQYSYPGKVEVTCAITAPREFFARQQQAANHDGSDQLLTTPRDIKNLIQPVVQQVEQGLAVVPPDEYSRRCDLPRFSSRGGWRLLDHHQNRCDPNRLTIRARRAPISDINDIVDKAFDVMNRARYRASLCDHDHKCYIANLAITYGP